MKKLLIALLFAALAIATPAQIQNMQAASGTTGDLTKPTGGFNLASTQVLNVKSGATISGAGSFDFGSGTKFVLPNSASPTTSAFGWMAGDNNAWASGRGAVQFYDGTAATYLIGVLVSSTPSDGKIPVWHTGGTITWDAQPAGSIGGSSGSTDKALIRANGTAGATIQSSTATLTDDAALTLPQAALAANTSGDGAVLSNTGTASSGNQRYSPRLRLTGVGWKTNATAAGQNVDWVAETIPVQGAANPTSQLTISSQVNAGGYTNRLVLDSGGVIYLGPSATAPYITPASGAITFTATGTNQNINFASSGTGFISVAAVTNQSTARIGGTVFQTFATNNEFIGDNLYYDGANVKYIATGFGAYLQINNGQFQFKSAVSGTAGNTATVTQWLGIDNAGIATLAATTASTSKTTGSLVNGGGLGNAGAIFGGDKIVSVGPTQGVGYATGAGGTVTQATNKSTGVTLSKVCGQITMNNASLSALTAVSFTLTNTTIATTDVVIVNIASGGTVGDYLITVNAVGSGSCQITVYNCTAATPLSEALVLNFAVIKAVSS